MFLKYPNLDRSGSRNQQKLNPSVRAHGPETHKSYIPGPSSSCGGSFEASKSFAPDKWSTYPQTVNFKPYAVNPKFFRPCRLKLSPKNPNPKLLTFYFVAEWIHCKTKSVHFLGLMNSATKSNSRLNWEFPKIRGYLILGFLQ